MTGGRGWRPFARRRNVVGLPAAAVDSASARHRPFVEAVDRLLATPRALVLNTSTGAALRGSCPGGCAYLGAALRRAPQGVHWIDCGALWTFRDGAGRQVRSAEHLYRSLEQLLARAASLGCAEVFLLRPGSPMLGDELGRLWMERHGPSVFVYDAPSPLSASADAVERLLGAGSPAGQDRVHLAAAAFAELTVTEIRKLSGLLVIRSVDNVYARGHARPDLVSRTLARLTLAFPATTETYLCHIGQEQYVVRCRLSEVPSKWGLLSRVVRPWTIVVPCSLTARR